MEYKISRYKKKYASQFYLLNKDWISESWDLEESDLNDLLSPETAIIKLGGEIFFCYEKQLCSRYSCNDSS